MDLSLRLAPFLTTLFLAVFEALEFPYAAYSSSPSPHPLLSPSPVQLTLTAASLPTSHSAKRSPQGPSPPLLQSRTQQITFTGKLDSTSRRNPNGSYYNTHQFAGKAGQPITLEMVTQDFTAYLTLIDPQNRVLNIKSGIGVSPRIGRSLPVTGTYTIVASALSAGQTGNYQIQLNMLPPPQSAQSEPSATDDRSVTATVSQRFTGVRKRDISIFDGNPLFDEHQFQGIAGAAIAIEMTSREMDAYLTLRDTQGKILQQDDNGLTGTNARIVLRLPTTGTYTIDASSGVDAIDLNKEYGSYTVQVRSANRSELQLIEAEQLNRKAEQLIHQRDYAEALPLQKRQVQVVEQALGKHHPNLIYPLDTLASLQEALGNPAAAETLRQRVLTIAEQSPGGSASSATLSALKSLINFYQRQGKTTVADRRFHHHPFRASLSLKSCYY